MRGFLLFIKDIFDNFTVLIFIIIAILSLVIDGSKYKAKNSKKELKIVKAISYSYMAIAAVLFILLWIG